MRQRCSASQKTAEERFNMLARGWLAYLFRNPVRGAKRMRARILRILLISRAGGMPLPMAGRLT